MVRVGWWAESFAEKRAAVAVTVRQLLGRLREMRSSETLHMVTSLGNPISLLLMVWVTLVASTDVAGGYPKGTLS